MQKMSSTPSLIAGRSAASAAMAAPSPELASPMIGADNAWNQGVMGDGAASMSDASGMGGGILAMLAADQAGAADDPPASNDIPIWATGGRRNGFGHRESGSGVYDDDDLEYDEDATWKKGPGGKSFGFKDLWNHKKNKKRKQDDKFLKKYEDHIDLWDLDDEYDDMVKLERLRAERAEEEEKNEEKKKKEEKSLKKKLEKYGITKDSASFGKFRDETQIDATSFMDDRSDPTWDGVGSYTGTQVAKGRDGTEHATHRAQARAGTTIGTNSSSVFYDGDATTQSGGSANLNADINSEASAGTYEVAGGVGARADASARVGVSGNANGGVKRTHDLGGRVSGNLEAGGEIDSFIGAEVHSGGSAEAVAGRASAQGKAGGSIGAKVDAKGEAQASLNAGRTRILGVRGKGEVDAFAGAQVGVDGKAEASIKEGLKVSGGGSAMAGAEIKGEASVGVTVGGVDADVVAEGEAFAGARADAQGSFDFGPTGGELSLGGEAFAGARAEGSVGVVLGAAGLSFGQIQITGKVKAGAGGKVDFNAKVKDGEIGGNAEASGAVGVGMGMAVAVKGDVLFIPRLIVDQVVKNGPVVAADNGSANMDGCNWVVRPAGPAAEGARQPASEQPLSKFLEGLDEESAAPYVEEQSLANLASEDAYDAIGQSAQGALSSAMSMLGRLGPTILAKIFEAEEAHAEALEAIGAVLVAAGDHAGTIFNRLGSIGMAAVNELGALLATPIWDLLDRDFESVVEDVLLRVDTLIRQIQVELRALLAETRDAVVDVGTKAGRLVMLPLRGIADVAGGVIGEFGMDIVGPGQDIVFYLEDAFGPAEEGIEVPGTGAEIAIQHPVTPGLAPGRKVLNDGAAFFEGASEGSFGDVIEEIASPILNGVFVDAPMELLAWGESLLDSFEASRVSVWEPVQSLVRTAAFFVAPAVNGLRSFLLSLGINRPAPSRSAGVGSGDVGGA